MKIVLRFLAHHPFIKCMTLVFSPQASMCLLSHWIYHSVTETLLKVFIFYIPRNTILIQYQPDINMTHVNCLRHRRSNLIFDNVTKIQKNSKGPSWYTLYFSKLLIKEFLHILILYLMKIWCGGLILYNLEETSMYLITLLLKFKVLLQRCEYRNGEGESGEGCWVKKTQLCPNPCFEG